MKSKLLRKKLMVIVVVTIMTGVVVGGWFYLTRSKPNCISYYGKDGKVLLYQDCQ